VAEQREHPWCRLAAGDRAVRPRVAE